MPDDLRWSWCNNNRHKVHNRWNVLESSWTTPSPLPTTPKSMEKSSPAKLVPGTKKGWGPLEIARRIFYDLWLRWKRSGWDCFMHARPSLPIMVWPGFGILLCALGCNLSLILPAWSAGLPSSQIPTMAACTRLGARTTKAWRWVHLASWCSGGSRPLTSTTAVHQDLLRTYKKFWESESGGSDWRLGRGVFSQLPRWAFKCIAQSLKTLICTSRFSGLTQHTGRMWYSFRNRTHFI